MSETLTDLAELADEEVALPAGVRPTADAKPVGGRLKKPMLTCGYCAFGGNHHQCPGGVRNGNGSIAVCACRETPRCGSVRCTDCNNREAGTIGSDWKCLDKLDCAAAQERSAQKNPTYLRVREIREAHGKPSVGSHPTDTAPAAPRPRKAPSQAGKPCLCECGETTGGGTFRPGHDSKYLNRLVEAGDQTAKNLAYAVSEAFGKKYEKRTAK